MVENVVILKTPDKPQDRIVRDLREVLTKAELGEVVGYVLTTVDQNGDVWTQTFIGDDDIPGTVYALLQCTLSFLIGEDDSE